MRYYVYVTVTRTAATTNPLASHVITQNSTESPINMYFKLCFILYQLLSYNTIKDNGLPLINWLYNFNNESHPALKLQLFLIKSRGLSN